MIYLEKKILKLSKKANKVLVLFEKMINRLIRLNAKLETISIKAAEEAERQNKISSDAWKQMQSNEKQIEKLHSFIGKGDNIE